MSKKPRYEPRQPKTDPTTHLEAQPGRDPAALIIPVLRRSLRSTGTDEQLLKLAINGLLEVAERLACTMGLERFDTNRSS